MTRPRQLAVSLFALTLTLAPIMVHAQQAPATDPAAAPLVGLSVPPLTKDLCPDSHPVKGNKSGRQAERPSDPIYHVPGGRYYAVTDPEECFASAADAELAGYRAPLR